jgi:hypothetical protein
MKTLSLVLIMVIIASPIAGAGNYYELEEWNSDAIGIPYAPPHRGDTVFYYDRYGRKIYDTRYEAERRGYYPYRRGTVLTGPGKYRREVRREEKKGILTSILEILL